MTAPARPLSALQGPDDVANGIGAGLRYAGCGKAPAVVMQRQFTEGVSLNLISGVYGPGNNVEFMPASREDTKWPHGQGLAPDRVFPVMGESREHHAAPPRWSGDGVGRQPPPFRATLGCRDSSEEVWAWNPQNLSPCAKNILPSGQHLSWRLTSFMTLPQITIRTSCEIFGLVFSRRLLEGRQMLVNRAPFKRRF